MHFYNAPMFPSVQVSPKFITPVTPRQHTRLTTTNAVEINRRKYGVNTCLETICHGSV